VIFRRIASEKNIKGAIMNQAITVAITGAAGRMGLSLIRALSVHPSLRLVACGIRPGTRGVAKAHFQQAGLDFANGFLVESVEELVEASQLVIDFSNPAHTLEVARAVAAKKNALVSGTTGLTAEHKQALMQASETARVLWSANMSVGVNLLMALVEKTAHALDAHTDIEIVEMHHKHKVDAPSGTALALGEAAARGRGVDLHDVWVKSRDSLNVARKAGDIGFASLRGGDVVGEHSVIFAADGERLELSHRATSRDIFTSGALKAAEWLAVKPVGFYTMRDVVKF
jgi:4-hydroxy-tetrahydrodipicolinate reductase